MLRFEHPQSVFLNMEAIMMIVLDESEDIPLDIISLLLDNIKKENQVIICLVFCLVCFVFFSLMKCCISDLFLVSEIVTSLLEIRGECYNEVCCYTPTLSYGSGEVAGN